MKRRMDMKMAGVAEPTVTRELRRVFTLKASPHPGMNIGVCNLPSKSAAFFSSLVAYLEEPQCNEDDKENKDLDIVRRFITVHI